MFKLVSERFVPRQPNGSRLWHFVRLSQLSKLQTFLKWGIWLARLDQFKDELEGTLPEANLGLLQKLMPPAMVDATADLYRADALRGYASCWHLCDGDPDADMWRSKFGSSGRAIALRTSPALLSAATARFLGPSGPCYLGQVSYVDHEEDAVPEANTIEVAFVVQNRFAFQREVRLDAHTLSDAAYGVFLNEQLIKDQAVGRLARPDELIEYTNEMVGNIPLELGPKLHGEYDGKALILPIRPETYIDEILIGSKVRDEEVQALTEQLQEAGLADRVRRL